MDIVNVGTVGHCDHNVSNEHKALYAEIQTLRAKVEVLEEYKNAVIDHFIVAFHGYDESKSVYDNLSLLIAYYQELALDPKVSKEASDLHAKVEVLVEALSIAMVGGDYLPNEKKELDKVLLDNNKT